MLNLPRCLVVSTFLFLSAQGCDNSPTTPPPPVQCTFSVAPSSATLPAAGGTAALAVTTQAACSWTASTTTPWLGVSPATGTGSGTSTITAQANASTDTRNGSVAIAGVTVAVQQGGAPITCIFAITPTSATFDEEGGNGTVTITAPPACAWQATTGTSWLTVISGASGTGTGTMSYKVEGNPSPLARSGTLTLAGLSLRVEQDGDVSACTYQVSPVQLSICMAWSTDLVSTITTQDGCPWTAASTSGWMPVTDGASGMGSGTVRIRGTDNYDASRSGIVQVRWPTVTAGQNVAVSQAGCSYAVTPTTFNMPVGGGTGRFDVLQQSDPISCGGPLQNACVWTAATTAPWITITSPATRTGDEAVTFSVGANTTGAARSGTITVRDKVVQVNQAGS